MGVPYALFNKNHFCMKYLIIGLGNIGSEYANTRHNIGFIILDRLAKEAKAEFITERYASRTEIRHKGRTLVLIKPTTYMNLSGKAVKYWLNNEKISIENSLTIVDDLALDLGVLRMKKGGSDGGHNGLADINMQLGTKEFPRLRFGIGANFPKGRQVDYVLEKFPAQELEAIDAKIDLACQMILSFTTVGIQGAMNQFNNK